MKRMLIFAGMLAVLAGCSDAEHAKVVRAAQTPMGALFCRIQTAGGGTILANVVQVGAASAGVSGPVVALATNAGKKEVDQMCADAAVAAGGSLGTAVSPPADLNTQIAQIAVAALLTPTTATK